MKIFRIVIERDGATTTENGKTVTDIVREERRYAADTIDDVWNEIGWLRSDPDNTLIAILEEAPSITVLPLSAKESA